MDPRHFDDILDRLKVAREALGRYREKSRVALELYYKVAGAERLVETLRSRVREVASLLARHPSWESLPLAVRDELAPYLKELEAEERARYVPPKPPPPPSPARKLDAPWD